MVKKYVALMEKYVEQITAKLATIGGLTNSVKIRDNMRYVFGMMDDGTRFRIVS